MAPINRIEANVVTGDAADAGTYSEVYLGMAGREFHLSIGGDDFQPGQTDRFVLGEGANVTDPWYKDPRRPQLDTVDLERFPIYIRMHPGGEYPAWLVERVWVVVNPENRPREYDNLRLAGADQQVWLHQPYGLVLHLFRS